MSNTATKPKYYYANRNTKKDCSRRTNTWKDSTAYETITHKHVGC